VKRSKRCHLLTSISEVIIKLRTDCSIQLHVRTDHEAISPNENSRPVMGHRVSLLLNADQSSVLQRYGLSRELVRQCHSTSWSAVIKNIHRLMVFVCLMQS